ncbi:MAG: hypothetical protein R3245_07185 [Kiloniellales bacterium]|nr:hypothetical protein [Kiloniellales bacterium]
MTDPMIASLIREVLAEELQRIGRGKGGIPRIKPRVCEVEVSIKCDADLQSFVDRLISISENASEWRKLKSGNLVFRLASAKNVEPTEAPAIKAEAQHVERIESGLLTERQVDRLSPGIQKILLAKDVRTTPLARDRLRQRGILIERIG